MRGVRHGGHTMRALMYWRCCGVSVENLIVFPVDWDDNAIDDSIRRVIARPDAAWRQGDRVKLEGTVNGVVICVYINVTGHGPRLRTAAPQRGKGAMRMEQGILREVL